MADAEQSGAKLESWKAIAVYLGRDVRTVQRWERHEGLPVHRLHHQKRGSVYAFAHELDTWAATRRSSLETPPAPPAVTVSDGPEPAPVIAARRHWYWAG